MIQQLQDLLEKINEKIDDATLEKLEALQQKQNSTALTTQEQEELTQIIAKIENFDAQRIVYLRQLATLKNISVQEVLKELKIYPKINDEVIHC